MADPKVLTAEEVQQFRDADGPVGRRFWAKVDTSGDCWLWQGYLNQGYGRFCITRDRPVRPHRLAYEALVGPIPEGLVLDHLCRIPACVNPAHLEPVTQRENLLRGQGILWLQPRQTHCRRGGHPLSGDNLYVHPNGERRCRTCRRESSRRLRERRAAAGTEVAVVLTGEDGHE